MNDIDLQFGLLARLMGASIERHDVLAANLANVNTPGYKAKELRFEASLAEALKGRGGKEEALLRVKAEVREREGVEPRPDGNTVRLETEIGEASKNSMLYSTWARILAMQAAKLRSAAAGRSL
jgi:flagellar basal-body rod protein FlgB